MAGTGIWCALGQLSVAHPDVPSVRLAAPMPWLWWGGAVLLAFAVRGWRRSPIAASPALLATLAWWPVPLPAIALLWTGRLAWLPIGLAFLAALMQRWPARAEQAAGGSVRSAAVLAGALTLAGSSLVAWSLAPRLPGGDEPHYLVITQSVLLDGDLRIQNNHDRRDYAAYAGGTLSPDFIQRGRDGEIYSIHAPGTSLLVLPAFAMFGYRGAQITVIVLSAVAGALVWLIGWAATSNRRAAWFAWAAVVGTAPFLVQSVTIFPDGPGLLVVAAAILLLAHLDRDATLVSTRALVGVSILLAALPWLHTRFVVLAAGLGVLVVWTLLRAGADRWRRIGAFLAVPAVSALGWFGFFVVIYGTANPSAPYGTDTGIRFGYIPGGVAGLLFDGQFGLLTYGPVLAAACGAVAWRRSRGDRPMWPAALVALAYLLVAGTYFMWWAGVPATPARFAAAVLPVLAAPMAVAFSRRSPAGRAILWLLLGVSLATSVVLLGADHGALAWNTRGVRSDWLDSLAGVVDLSRGWPSFFWRTTPGVVATEAHFAVHVLSWLVVVVVASLAIVVLPPAVKGSPTAPALAAWWVVATMMTIVQTGWIVNGVSGVRAMTSQIDVLRAHAQGRAVVAISPWAWPRQSNVTSAMAIRVDRSDWFDGAGASWTPLAGVPAGQYEATVVEDRPRGGTLALRVDRAADPIRTVPLAPLSRQTFTFDLASPATSLVFEPDTALAAVARSLDLRAVSLASPTSQATRVGDVVRARATFGDATVSFFDDHVHVESDGFWIKGGEVASFSVAVPAGRTTLTLQLANGAAPNAVGVEVEGRAEDVALGAYESRAVVIPVDAAGVARLVVRSPSGFRPSEVQRSADARYLGVRVRVVP